MPAKLRPVEHAKTTTVKPSAPAQLDPISDAASEELLNGVTERLGQLLEKHRDAFGAGRGQVAQFARVFSLAHGTANRFLTGQTMMPAVVMVAVSKKLGVSVDWLLGLERKDLDSALKQTFRFVDFFDPLKPQHDSSQIRLSGTMMPEGLETASLVVCDNSTTRV